ncbi:MAG: acyl-CoA dehydrogenase family protein [Deltaproteobacteria bacterium]|nr:acyl-CoA dehydrogenase family protein [Deltaproteobacteria bacterium]
MKPTADTLRQHFVDLAAAHADDFKTRATKHDRENSFPFENMEAMKASGYTNMTLPTELGGGGVSVLDLTLAQERLARGDGPTAVAVNMHLLVAGMYADFWRSGAENLHPFLESIARDHLILASGTNDPRISSAIGLAGLADTTRRAEKYRVAIALMAEQASGR